jgi:sodium transport system permease protein
MIGTIFKKELKDTLRDRRTLITMIVIPMLIFPVIMTLFLKVSDSFSKEAAEKKLYIGVLKSNEGEQLAKDLAELPASFGTSELVYFKDSVSLKKFVNEDSVQLGISLFSTGTDSVKVSQKTLVYFNATELGMLERAKTILSYLAEKEKDKRLAALKINAQEINPYEFSYQNVASEKETFGKLAGGFLPYLFIVFGFIGCMYPAIDLFTGEKERGTLETLLTTPTSRWQILIGKMGVVVLSGLMAASFTLFGIFMSIEFLDLVKDPKLLEIIHQILSFKFLALLYLLLIPMIIFFAGLMVPIAVYAKTFKEAQSIITPLNMVVILPAMIGFFPGIELNAITACIPIVNVVLATKELVAGTLDLGYLLLSFGVMLGIASVAVYISYLRFDKESNLV